MRKLLDNACFIAATIAVMLVSQPCFAGSPPNFVLEWGVLGNGNGEFNGPNDVCVDAAGNVYVTDTANHRIQKFTSNGAYLTQWGGLGSGDGQFISPVGVAVDAAGNVYVTDAGNNRVQKFTAAGDYLTQWSSGFNVPVGIAVDADGEVFVADTQNNQIKKFTNLGGLITTWGGWGSENGEFIFPYGIAIDAAGNVFVADNNNDRIQKFTNDGTYLLKWGSNGSGNSQFVYPFGVRVDASGNVYVGDSRNDRVQMFANNGTYLTQWGTNGNLQGQFAMVFGVGVDANYNVYVVDWGNNRIQKFGSTMWTLTASAGSGGSISPSGTVNVYNGDNQSFAIAANSCYSVADVVVDGVSQGPLTSYTFTNVTANHTITATFTNLQCNYQYLTQWGGCGVFNTPHSLAVAVSGVYVTDNHRVTRFDHNGGLLNQWGGLGSYWGQFQYPWGVAIDASYYVHVGDSQNSRIQRFDYDGRFISDLLIPGGHWPFGVAVDAGGTVFAVVPSAAQIMRFGEAFTAWGSPGSGESQFSSPYDAAVDASGNVYVADPGNRRIQKFSNTGVFLKTWGWGVSTGAAAFEICTSGCRAGISGNGPGQLESPIGVGVDISGNVFVADQLNHQILKFTGEGELITQWGTPGSGDGQLMYPQDVAVDAAGNVYVTDAGNCRVQKFGIVVIGVDPDGTNPTLALAPCTPNPWADRTMLQFLLSRHGPAKLTVYDLAGRRLKQWSWSSLSAGPHEVAWDGTTDNGQSTRAGVLFYRLETSDQVRQQRMVRIR